MRKLGAVLAALSLVAMTPSDAYGKRATLARASGQANLFNVSGLASKGQNRFLSFVNNTATNTEKNGSLLQPYHKIEEAIKNSRPGATIYVLNGGAPYTISGEGVSLKDGQRLIGSAIRIKVQGKAVAGATPGRRPTIIVTEGANGMGTTVGDTGIFLGQNNQVSGFQFETSDSDITAVGGGITKSCTITKNSFTGFATAIDFSTAPMASNTRLDIDNNNFSECDTGLLIMTPTDGEKIRASICRNSFTYCDQGLSFKNNTLTPVKEEEKAESLPNRIAVDSSLLEEELDFVEEIESPTSSGLIRGTSSKIALFVNRNTFEYLHSNEIHLSGTQEASIKGNQFKYASSELSVHLAEGALAYIQNNNFSKAARGLSVHLYDGGTACVSDNTFSETRDGFSAEGSSSSSGAPNCLQLIRNRAKNDEVGFAIKNKHVRDTFQVVVRDNIGTLTLLESEPCVFVKKCSNCCLLK